MQNLFKELTTKRYVNGNTMKANSNNVLDKYFTKPSVALKCFQKACEIIKKYENLEDFIFLEPSAGNGVFYDLFPKDRRIGIDIEPKRDEFIQCDFLNYALPKDKKIICLGNPPFGHRGVMALEFINHAKNCDFVCFILPMFFESQGKGSIKYRVKGLNLLHSERLEKNAFIDFKNKEVDVHCVFQIWSKKYQSNISEFSWYQNRHKEPFNEYIKVFTVSLAKNRECGKEWIFDKKASFYISSTFYKSTHIVESFEEVKYKSGIAVVFVSENEALNFKLKSIFKEIDWTQYASLATNSCYHLGKSHIFQALCDNLDKLKGH
ncbi:SAM-dependent methyltransferase [Helicobacter cetorum]|uniref:SAM-dependent methyltransferase n=1 Tax=Helicobacter cetorum TaxID=138563 RepID=UPI000CF0B170|nr:SAM-dependent methyltransferase [Helicobacter cetorum]